MKIVVLASGSKGNATYIENDNTKILIDAGISFRQIKKRLEENDIIIDGLSAILLTHEHDDHVSGLGVLLGNIDTNLYMTKKCYEGFKGRKLDMIRGKKITLIESLTPFMIGNLEIQPFQLSHDAADCVGYKITDNETSMVYLTDTGYVSEKIYDTIKNATLYVMEFNHDVEMQTNSNRDFSLINRVLGDRGHLSNIDAAVLFCMIKGDNTKYLIPAHISNDCNCIDKIDEAINDIFNSYSINKDLYKIVYAKQNETTEVFEI